MSIVISYSLFDQFEKKYNRTGHDPYDRKPYRYWLNIPFVVVLNNLIFPESITRIYSPKIIEQNRYYPLLKALESEIESFELVKIDKSYIKTEPSIWRAKAIWDKKFKYCFCRDLDSVMIKKEAQAMIYFIKSGLMIHNIRSIVQHNGEGTSIMAGLSGYNIPKLYKDLPLPESYERYIEFYHLTTKQGVWGCDQEALISFFLRHRTSRITKQVLDTYIRQRLNIRKFGRVSANKFYEMTSIPENVYDKITFTQQGNEGLKISTAATNWAGEPVNTSGSSLKKLLATIKTETSKKVQKIINSDQQLKTFYKI